MIRGYSPEVVMRRIYTGWKEIPAVPHEARLLGYGLDFGFDPDPAAIVAVYYHNGGYILDERLYSKRLTNQSLATSIKLLPTAPIVADSAEPKSIAELAVLGIIAMPCTKGADSVDFGIKHVQALRVSYTATSKNLKDEYESYAWKRNKGAVEEDDHNGIEDTKCANHLMSAARYFLTEMVKANADPEAEARQREQAARDVMANQQRLTQNGAR
jgi:phage terminase large subunit